MRRRLLPALILAAVIAAAALPAWLFLHSPFQFDDDLILRDDNVRLGRWQEVVWPPRPRMLTWMTFLIQYQLHGPNPVPFHAFNGLLHGLNSALVLLILSRILGGGNRTSARSRLYLPALFGALLFAWHPLQSESVFYIYQRSTLLAGLFSLLAILAYLARRPLGAASSFALGALCKELALALPCALWTARGFLRGLWRPDRLLLSLAGATLLAIVGFYIWIGVSGEQTLGGDWKRSLEYAAAQAKVVWLYVLLSIFPWRLNLDWDIVPPEGWTDLSLLLPLAAWIAVAAAAVRWRTRLGTAGLFMSWFVIFLLPSSSLIPSQDLMFEHRTYLAMLGVAGMGGLLARRALEWSENAKGGVRPWRRRLTAAAASLVLAASLAAVVQRGEVWSDDIALWRDAARKSPGKYRPNFNLGVLLIESLPREALAHLRRAIEIDPDQAGAHRSLGQALLLSGDRDGARRAWQQALLLEPDDPSTLTALGQLKALQREFFEAKKLLQRAARLDPLAWRPHFHLAELNLAFGFIPEAIRHAEMGLERSPAQLPMRLLLADAVRWSRNYPRAAELYRECLASAPSDSRIHYRLARTLRAMDETSAACESARQGLSVAASPAQRLSGARLLQSLKCSDAG